MLFSRRSAIIIVLAAICPLTLDAKSPVLRSDLAITPIYSNAVATGVVSGKVTRAGGTTAIAGATVKVYQSTT